MSELKRYNALKKVQAKPMNRQEYNDLRGWDLPADEDGSDDGYLTVDINAEPNLAGYDGYVSWTPKAMFESQFHEVSRQQACTAPKDDRELTDDEIKRIRETGSLCDCHEFVDSDDSELPNPITPEFLESQIVSVTYTQLGKTLTHCQIEVKNGFVFTGESACADPENFDEVIGQKIAFENAKSKMWMPYGFLLKQQLAE